MCKKVRMDFAACTFQGFITDSMTFTVNKPVAKGGNVTLEIAGVNSGLCVEVLVIA
jgi:hypothetical protein